MASGTDDETIGYSFKWKIENISHCWLKKSECMMSPVFTADALTGNKWRLMFYPMGTNDENKLDFYLRREEDCTGPIIVEINYLLAFLDKDGTVLKEMNALPQISFEVGEIKGYHGFETRERIFVTEREAFLPDDTLTVQCTLWEKEQKPVKILNLYARTVFKVSRRSFLCEIENFSALISGQNKFKDDFVDFDIVLNEGQDFEKKVGIKVNSCNSIKYFSFKMSVVDSAGRTKSYGTHEYFQAYLSRGVSCTLLFTNELMKNKSRYFPNDVLTLDCEYVYSTGSYLYEYCDFLMTSPKSTNKIVANTNEHNIGKEESQHTSDLANDLKSIYNDAICSNTVLRTSTKNFSAHKVILIARSPVFRSMFNNDMKENSEHVDIADFEDNTIHRMLLYLYTDSLGDLQFQDASKLYKIADKYQIMSLKSRCSSFLKDNLCPSNSCEVLILADLHNDDGLKSAVQDYILQLEKQFFCSQEWKHFLKTHTELAGDIMCRKIYQE